MKAMIETKPTYELQLFDRSIFEPIESGRWIAVNFYDDLDKACDHLVLLLTDWPIQGLRVIIGRTTNRTSINPTSLSVLVGNIKIKKRG